MTITAGSSEVTTIKMTFRPRGGRTLIVRPDGSRGVVRREATIDNTMIKVIARVSVGSGFCTKAPTCNHPQLPRANAWYDKSKAVSSA